MFMAHTISSSRKPLPRATIALFDNPPPRLKSFSKGFPESHDPFGLDSYSDFLFQPWANPNTRHFDRAQAKLLEQGELVDESVWQHLSPLAWKHINLVGSYHFSDVHLQGEFRPLRELE